MQYDTFVFLHLNFNYLSIYLEYQEEGGLKGQSRFTFVVLVYIADVSLISVCRAQLHTIMISPCWARMVGGEHW